MYALDTYRSYINARIERLLPNIEHGIFHAACQVVFT